MLKIRLCFFLHRQKPSADFLTSGTIFYETEVSKQHPKLDPDFFKSAADFGNFRNINFESYYNNSDYGHMLTQQYYYE